METGRRLGGGLVLAIAVLLVAGFGGSSLFGFLAAREALRAQVAGRELPATAAIVHERIRKDLVRPIFIASMMANDSFLHAWARDGERDLAAVVEYLGQIQRRYGAFTSFFVSERTGAYYHAEGVLKRVRADEPRDAWYFRVRSMAGDYELNVDPDMAHGDTLTVFINYKVIGAGGEFLGAAGVGIAISSISEVARDFREAYDTWVYFVDERGRLIAGEPSGGPHPGVLTVYDDPALAEVAPRPGAEGDQGFTIQRGGSPVLLDVRYVPELEWYIYAEKPEGELVAGPRQALYLNIALAALVVGLVLLATVLTLRRYRARLVAAASHDPLTGCLNRRAFGLVAEHAMRRAQREGGALSAVILDLDDFKRLNDERGHLAGDAALVQVAGAMMAALRASDAVCRWGGEEFFVLLPGCELAEAVAVAEKLRSGAAAEAGGFRLTLSAGVARLGEGEDFDALTRRADAALYAAKRSGKDRVATASS